MNQIVKANKQAHSKALFLICEIGVNSSVLSLYQTQCCHTIGYSCSRNNARGEVDGYVAWQLYVATWVL